MTFATLIQRFLKALCSCFYLLQRLRNTDISDRCFQTFLRFWNVFIERALGLNGLIMHNFKPYYNLNEWVGVPKVVINGEISYRDHNVSLYQFVNIVYFCCRVGRFNIDVYGDWLTFGTSLYWPFEEFVALLNYIVIIYSKVKSEHLRLALTQTLTHSIQH